MDSRCNNTVYTKDIRRYCIQRSYNMPLKGL